MIQYLCNADYEQVIQSSQLDELIGGSTTKLSKAEQTALATAKSYLTQRWDISREFTDTLPWKKQLTYKPGHRITLDFPAFSTSVSYSVNDTVIYGGKAYASKNNLMPGAFNPLQWNLLGDRFDIFNGKYPYPEYNSNDNYSVGDMIYWNGYTYVCNRATGQQVEQTIIQYNTYNSAPPKNQTPDSEGQTQWGTKTIYNIPIGTIPTVTNYWVVGDNRSSQMVMCVMDIALYNLHKSISPQNVPELRKDAYKVAIEWLKMCSKAEVTPELPKLQPSQGQTVRWSSKTKKTYDY